MSELRIKDLTEGLQLVGLPALVTSARKMNFSKKEGFFLVVDIQDGSGILSDCKIWDASSYEDLPTRISENNGVYCFVNGEVISYQGNIQINIKSLIPMEDDQIDYSRFLPVVQKDRTAMFQKLLGLIKRVDDPSIKNLLTTIFGDEKVRNAFIESVAAIKHHHNYLSGLLEHTLQVAITSYYVATDAELFPECKKDVLIAGSILHDIGKMYEYAYTKRISMADLPIDHRYQGVSMLDALILKHDIEIDPTVLWEIKHIIMAHHGDFGDIKMRTPEVMCVHYADCISAKLNGYFKDKDLLGKPASERKELY